MPRLIVIAFAATMVVTEAGADTGIDVTADPECRVVRILPNGRRIERPATPGVRRRDAGRSAAAVSTGGSSAAVSVSASSGGSGYASSSATSTSGRRGRTVTTTNDENGCTVVIDERGRRGGTR